MSGHGWVTFEDRIEIAAPPEVVFDYVTDPTNELE
jgi:uncharacterized protein YndB with AHSA1/START domain